MNEKREILNKLFTEIQTKRLMNGTVLVAQDGELLYKGAFGEAELDSNS